MHTINRGCFIVLLTLLQLPFDAHADEVHSSQVAPGPAAPSPAGSALASEEQVSAMLTDGHCELALKTLPPALAATQNQHLKIWLCRAYNQCGIPRDVIAACNAVLAGKSDIFSMEEQEQARRYSSLASERHQRLASELRAMPVPHASAAPSPPASAPIAIGTSGLTPRSPQANESELPKTTPVDLQTWLSSAKIVPSVAKPRKNLIVAGSVILGVSYLTAAIPGAVGSSYIEPTWPLVVPVLGPWIQIISDSTWPRNKPTLSGDTQTAAFEVINGLVQAAGLTMIIVGAAYRRRVPIQSAVSVGALSAPGSGGLVVLGRF